MPHVLAIAIGYILCFSIGFLADCYAVRRAFRDVAELDLSQREPVWMHQMTGLQFQRHQLKACLSFHFVVLPALLAVELTDAAAAA